MKKQLLLLALLYIANGNAYGEPKSPKAAFECNCETFKKYLDDNHIHQRTYNYFKEKLEKKRKKTIEKKEEIEQKQQELQGKRDLRKIWRGSFKFVGAISSAAIAGIQSLILVKAMNSDDSIENIIDNTIGWNYTNTLLQDFMFDQNNNPTSRCIVSIIGLFGLSAYFIYSGYNNIKLGLKPALALEKDKEKIMQKLKEIKCKDKVLEESRTYYRST